jgi:glycine/D-amino acid oxidase-like deaminating enzyme
VKDVVVVGAGIVGRVIARQAASRGRAVTLYDAGLSTPGSPASAGLIKASWSDVGRATFMRGLATLDALDLLQSLALTQEERTVDVHRVDFLDMMSSGRDLVERRRVIALGHGTSFFLDDSEEVTCRTLVLACGMWANELVGHAIEPVEPRFGVALSFGHAVERATIKWWAPYKQTLLIPRGGTTHATDGTSVREWQAQLAVRCADHAREADPALTGVHWAATVGARPYAESGWIIKQLRPEVHVVTGGRKTGTLLAGVAAATLFP